MKKRIIICGYPKSGNTWLTRLTAEILRCPAIGFWCEPFNKEESIEGLDRESEFQCFKTHITFEQMTQTLNVYGNGSEKIIYIYRDPRSVIVSASHYFKFSPKYPRLRYRLNYFPKGYGIYNKLLHTHAYKLGAMTRGLVEGTTQGLWLQEPWKKHVIGYQNKDNVLALSYEYLRTDPLSATRKISQFLSINRTDMELEEAIQAQSFAKKKIQFQSDGKKSKANFLRKGKTDSWRNELPAHNLKYIEKEIGDFMQELGYELSCEQDKLPDTVS